MTKTPTRPFVAERTHNFDAIEIDRRAGRRRYVMVMYDKTEITIRFLEGQGKPRNFDKSDLPALLRKLCDLGLATKPRRKVLS